MLVMLFSLVNWFAENSIQMHSMLIRNLFAHTKIAQSDDPHIPTDFNIE